MVVVNSSKLDANLYDERQWTLPRAEWGRSGYCLALKTTRQEFTGEYGSYLRLVLVPSGEVRRFSRAEDAVEWIGSHEVKTGCCFPVYKEFVVLPLDYAGKPVYQLDKNGKPAEFVNHSARQLYPEVFTIDVESFFRGKLER